MPLKEAIAALENYCQAIPPVETSVENALDRIAAAPIPSPAAVPPYPIALCDGWAVAAAETLGASSYAPSFASITPRRVAFGDPMPDFADAVLPLPNVAFTPSSAGILSPIAPGEGVRARASDFAEGEIIVAAGRKLRAIDIALLRSAGIENVCVRIPRVRILSQCSAGHLLAAMARQEGADCRIEAPDQIAPKRLVEEMAHPDADLMIMIGAGGTEDLAVQAAAQGGQILFHGIAMRPGETIGCAILPGKIEPDSANTVSPVQLAGASAEPAPSSLPVLFTADRMECMLAAWFLFVRPYMRRLAGATVHDAGEALPLTRKIVSMPGVSELALVRRVTGSPDRADRWEPLATGDIPFATIARADAWLLVGPESEGYAAGKSVAAQFL
jgi:molybdopterin molybdotransferase